MKNWKLISGYFKRHIFQVFLIILFTGLGVLFQMNVPKIMSNVVNEGIIQNDLSKIYGYGFKMIVISVLALISSFFSVVLISRISSEIAGELRYDLYSKIESFSVKDSLLFGKAYLINSMTVDTAQIRLIINLMLRMFLRILLTLITGIYMIVSTDESFLFITLSILFLIFIFVYCTGRKTIPLFEKIMSEIDKITAFLRENIKGIAEIKSFNKVSYRDEIFKSKSDELERLILKVNKYMSFLTPGVMLITNYSIIIILYIGFKNTLSGKIQIGNLIALVQYMTFISLSVVLFTLMLILLPRAFVSAGRISKILDYETEIVNNGNTEIQNIENLEFKNVSFSYNEKEKVLSDISFKLNKGETLGVIGHTGSGKSSLIKLIIGLFNNYEGEILVNGKKQEDIDINFFRKLIGYVPQRGFLFSGSVRDNFLMANNDISEEDMKNAIKLSLAEFIYDKEGLDFKIVQDGKNLSGGQKQRLSIAQSIVRKPDLYLFDDSFSALDFRTEKLVRENLQKISKDKITVIVTQRILSAMKCDKILVLNNGKCEGCTSHEELMKISDFYLRLYNSQIKGGESYGKEA